MPSRDGRSRSRRRVACVPDACGSSSSCGWCASSPLPPRADRRVVASGRRHCRLTLARDQELRAGGRAGDRRRRGGRGRRGGVGGAHGRPTARPCPGDVVRSAGEPASGDAAVDEAADGVTATLALYRDAFARSSYDGKGAAGRAHRPLRAGLRQRVLERHAAGLRRRRRRRSSARSPGRSTCWATSSPTRSPSSPRTSTYQGQSGALNESVSDCFGMCVKQRVLGQTADQADWLVGEGIFLPGIHARALRDMAAPRHGLRRPDARARTPRSATWPTTSTPPTTTAASTPTPASPTAPSTSPPPRSAATPGRAPDRSGTPR